MMKPHQLFPGARTLPLHQRLSDHSPVAFATGVSAATPQPPAKRRCSQGLRDVERGGVDARVPALSGTVLFS